jgi:hypothetical protein
MITITNPLFTLTCDENGHNLTLTDRPRGTRWVLDEKSLVYGGVSRSIWGGPDSLPLPLLPAAARSDDPGTLIVSYYAGAMNLDLAYTLHEGYVEVRLPVPMEGDIGLVSLPGSFMPQEERLTLLLPIMQGMLWDGRGRAFSQIRGEGSHLGFSMAFAGFLGERGGLLVTAETRDDCRWWFGKEQAGDEQADRIWATNLQIDSLGTMRYERIVRLYLTDADIVAVAKQYRRKVIEQGRFITWDEKIAQRPAVERLFGALMCYIGYCEDDVDYLEGCRKLKAYGFDRALVYPARFNIYYPDIRMGGVPAINLPGETVEAIQSLGYEVAPWSWLNEALDTGAEAHRIYRRNAEGKIIPHWAIDDQQWYLVCYSTIVDYQRRALQECIPDMNWDHFDVLACVPPMECYALDHPQHAGHPLTRSEDRQWVRQTFLADQTAGRIVSSENFNDGYSLEYDIGSVKAWPQYGPWPFWPVPLTMLVYHDSLIHSWWEIHSYNNPWRGRTTMLDNLFEYGGGRARLMAALDALMGCPPDVFPFGAQYGYSGHAKETFLYKYRFEDPEVQVALKAALPVARLHQRIGKQELVNFKILSEDGYVQETTFADGTRVVANFSQDFVGEMAGVDHKIVQGIDRLGPESWQVANPSQFER